MMVEITYQMVLSTLQTAGILAGITYYIMTLTYSRRNQEQTLMTRKITSFENTLGAVIKSSEGPKYTRIIDDNAVSSYEEHMELTRKNPDYYEAWYNIFISLDFIGIYLKKGVLDIDMFAMFNPWWYNRFWNRYKPIIHEMRKRDRPGYMINLEYLMDSLEKYLKEHPELLSS